MNEYTITYSHAVRRGLTRGTGNARKIIDFILFKPTETAQRDELHRVFRLMFGYYYLRYIEDIGNLILEHTTSMTVPEIISYLLDTIGPEVLYHLCRDLLGPHVINTALTRGPPIWVGKQLTRFQVETLLARTTLKTPDIQRMMLEGILTNVYLACPPHRTVLDHIMISFGAPHGAVMSYVLWIMFMTGGDRQTANCLVAMLQNY